MDAAAPWAEPSTYGLVDGNIVGTAPGLQDPNQTGHFRLVPNEKPDSAASYATPKDMVTAVQGGTGAPGSGAVALRYALDKGETVTFSAEVADKAIKGPAPGRGAVLSAIERGRAKADAARSVAAVRSAARRQRCATRSRSTPTTTRRHRRAS